MAGAAGFWLLLPLLRLLLRDWWVFRLRHRFGQRLRFRLRLRLGLLPPCWLGLLWLGLLLLLLLLWGFRLGVRFRLLRLGRHRALLRGCGVILAGNA